jgi:general secretion pathway protein C
MPVSRLHLGHLLLGALLLAAAVLAWRAVTLVRAPLPALPPFAAPALADRALLARFDPFFPASAGTGTSLPVTALPFSLHGVRADSATGRGSAIIATGDGQQSVYAVGDAVADGVTLAAIAPDHVVLDRGGVREALWIDSAGAEPVQRFDPAAAPQMQQPGQPQGATSASAPGADAPDEAPPSVMPGDEAQPVRAPQPAPAANGEGE